jgi:hypothetical protein
MLPVIGGFCAILLGLLVALVSMFWWAATWFFGPAFFIWPLIQWIIVNLIFGVGLLYGYVVSKHGDLDKGFIIVLICSIILFFGNWAGQLGGLLGIIGAILIWMEKDNLRRAQQAYAPPPPGAAPPPGGPPAPPPTGPPAPPPGQQPPPY